jgi:hypothetical protein
MKDAGYRTKDAGSRLQDARKSNDELVPGELSSYIFPIH